MKEPYAVPESSLEDCKIESISTRALLLSLGLLVFSLFIHIGVVFVIPQFLEVFAGFGADLPAITQFVLKTHRYYFLVFLLLLPICILLYRRRLIHKGKEKQRKHPLLAYSVLALLLTLAIQGFVMISMYIPIFYLGSVV
ncbi:hypothetical protein H0A36_28055 [Endozoicomonas sp. SM1973]|uniref:Uncharacterized protein n=1 Tax=Spartinivicinus marinus TaxID=2994442 RepID=A0A853IIH3_9GAMM|nr:hypothetical protein [Spartinivicinus marinus]MCX4026949.1 hypothetical protein [Spartinivicinus marinus]NYZ69871.1 hypothetical protein [Spartinivicinus marinus]